jgi:hypothetical protein
MFKRTVWFTVGLVGGAATGAGATAYAMVRWREVQGALAPERVAATVVSTARSSARSVTSSARSVTSTTRSARAAARANVRDALSEGRMAMVEAEARIIDELDRRDRRAVSADGAGAIGQ